MHQNKRKHINSYLDDTNRSLLDQNGGIRRNIILADPPWEYTISHHEKGTTLNGLSNQHYETMSLSDLKNLKVREIAARDCILFLWTTGCQMKNSLELMNAWGFTYKTMFMVWVKTTNGQVKANRLGFYTRQSCEYVLMGSRGTVLKYKNPEYRTPVCNVFEEDSKEHSRKPVYVRELIDRMFLNVPRIELFAREQSNTEDWDYWGNEVPMRDLMTLLLKQQEENATLRQKLDMFQSASLNAITGESITLPGVNISNSIPNSMSIMTGSTITSTIPHEITFPFTTFLKHFFIISLKKE